MLDKEDFDFYYLIICSRGPGSETITVNKVSNAKNNIEFDETAEEELKEFGVCGAGGEFNDEGPILAVPAGTKPLKGIYKWLVYDNDRWTADLVKPLSDDPEAIKRARNREKEFAEMKQAYISACLRVFLSSDIKSDNNPWTSVNGWRQVKIEILNKAQFEAFMEAVEQTADELLKWDCAVIKATAEMYKNKAMYPNEFQGC